MHWELIICYEDLKQQIIVQEVCDKDLMLIRLLVCPMHQQRTMLLILANGP